MPLSQIMEKKNNTFHYILMIQSKIECILFLPEL